MKLVKYIKLEKGKSKEGKEYRKSYFALEFENGKLIPIKPIFDDAYPVLEFSCEKRFEKEDK